MLVMHPKGVNIVWTCVKYNIIKVKEDYKAIVLRGFYYTFFRENEGGVVRELLYGYPYFMNLIKLWSGYLFNKMGKIHQSVGEKNSFDKSGGGGAVRPFTINEFWKFIWSILLSVTFVVKGYHIWVKPEASVSKKGRNTFRNPLHRDVCGKTYLLKVSFYICHPHYCYACH